MKAKNTKTFPQPNRNPITPTKQEPDKLHLPHLPNSPTKPIKKDKPKPKETPKTPPNKKK